MLLSDQLVKVGDSAPLNNNRLLTEARDQAVELCMKELIKSIQDSTFKDYQTSVKWISRVWDQACEQAHNPYMAKGYLFEEIKKVKNELLKDESQPLV